MFIVQASVKNLVFNDKECHILILKNLTAAFRFKKAAELGLNMRMLTTTVSHEMRLPLESVISMCRVMLYHSRDKQFIELLNSIKCASKFLLCRVNDLLDSSTLEKGTFTKNLKVFDIIKSVEDIVSINNPQA